MKKGQIVTAKIVSVHILFYLRAIFAKGKGVVIYNKKQSHVGFISFLLFRGEKTLL
jgi:hypothetical protein